MAQFGEGGSDECRPLAGRRSLPLRELEVRVRTGHQAAPAAQQASDVAPELLRLRRSDAASKGTGGAAGIGGADMPRKIGKRRKGRRIAGTRRPRVRAARVELEEGRRGTTQRRE